MRFLNSNQLHRLFLAVLAVVVIAAGLPVRPAAAQGEGPDSAQASRRFYLPVLMSGYANRGTDLPVMTGMYQTGSIWYDEEIKQKFRAMDAWITDSSRGRNTTFVALFQPLVFSGDPYMTITHQLEVIANNGYVPFVNYAFEGTSADLANGKYDADLIKMAKAYLDYTDGGTRIAFLAPLPEMNLGGDPRWRKPYTMDPVNFKRAFEHMVKIFEKYGVKRSMVRWVFAPNGWHYPGDPGFEAYYPGDHLVDAVAFSAFNFGYCPPEPDKRNWMSPAEIYNPVTYDPGEYLDRMRAMAPSKPIFLAQTATTALTAGGMNPGAKNEWLREAYDYLAGQKNVLGVMYFGIDNMAGRECRDYSVYNTWDPVAGAAQRYEGYKEAVTQDPYGYVTMKELMNADLTIR